MLIYEGPAKANSKPIRSAMRDKNHIKYNENIGWCKLVQIRRPLVLKE
jgi:hypothetical protein